jgi:hypothetical protein
MEISDNGELKTTFESVCAILSDLWVEHKAEKHFKDFIQYNDLGLPLAFLIDSELVEPSEMAKQYINETWNLLLGSLNIEKDLGWTSLEDLFSYVESQGN